MGGRPVATHQSHECVSNTHTHTRTYTLLHEWFTSAPQVPIASQPLHHCEANTHTDAANAGEVYVQAGVCESVRVCVLKRACVSARTTPWCVHPPPAGLRLGRHLGARAAPGGEEPHQRAAHRAQQLPLHAAAR